MLGSYWFLGIIVPVSVALSMLGLLLVRKYVNHQNLVVHHDVAGYMLSIVGTLYAVVLGFIVVDSLNTFQKARVTVEQEANALHDIFHLAQGLPAPISSDIRNTCLSYAKLMVTEEWPAMAAGRDSVAGHFAIDHLWTALVEYQPRTPDQINLQQALLSELNLAGDSRHTRLIGATPQYEPIIWGVLICGGVVLIVFTYLFGLEKLQVQLLMTGLVTMVLALNMVIIAMFHYPYSGDVHVSPTAFQSDVDYFESELTGSG